jgi:hypothetical protein
VAPYVVRVAINKRRLVKLENNQVSFRCRSSDTGQIKFCTLSAEEFIHRPTNSYNSPTADVTNT